MKNTLQFINIIQCINCNTLQSKINFINKSYGNDFTKLISHISPYMIRNSQYTYTHHDLNLYMKKKLNNHFYREIINNYKQTDEPMFILKLNIK